MTARSENLTARQQEILDFIRSTVESEGRPPTRAEPDGAPAAGLGCSGTRLRVCPHTLPLVH